MTESAVQELPNRVNTGASTAVRGSTTGVDTNDPLFLTHDGSHYVWFPGASGNNLGWPGALAFADGVTTSFRFKKDVDDWDGGTEYWFNHASGGRCYLIRTSTGMRVYFSRTSDSASVNFTVITDVEMAAAEWVQVEIGWKASGLHDLTGYTSLDAVGDHDSVTWTASSLGVVNPPDPCNIPTTGGTEYIGSTTVQPIQGFLYQFAALTDGAETVVVDPGADIDTSADPDAGQTSFTASTGQTVTVNRASSGLTTAVVTRPVALFDGTDDYLQLPASDIPSYTLASGKYSVVVLFRSHFSVGFGRLWSSEGSANRGVNIQLNATTAYVYQRDTPTALFQTRTYSAHGDLVCVAAVIDDGTMYAYTNTGGLSAGADISVLTEEPDFASSPRVGVLAYGVTSRYTGEVFSVLIFDDYALNEAQLDTLSTKLIAGTYT